jgi:hypothetical protein
VVPNAAVRGEKKHANKQIDCLSSKAHSKKKIQISQQQQMKMLRTAPEGEMKGIKS